MEEDITHCLHGCGSAKSLWLELGFGQDSDFFLDDLYSWLHRRLKNNFDPLFLVTLWWNWRWRNQSIFGNHNWSLHYVLHEVWSSYRMMMSACIRHGRVQQMPKQVLWAKLRSGELKIKVCFMLNYKV